MKYVFLSLLFLQGCVYGKIEPHTCFVDELGYMTEVTEVGKYGVVLYRFHSEYEYYITFSYLRDRYNRADCIKRFKDVSY